MISHIRRLLLAALMALFPVILNAAPAATQGNLDGFDVLMAKATEDLKGPGPAVVVVKDGKVLLVKGYGYRDTANKLPTTGKTLFPIASITKSFTVTALDTLVDQGRLDRPVREYTSEHLRHLIDL
jgi:CubicO group peptidase (beta-lactamase class C family)